MKNKGRKEKGQERKERTEDKVQFGKEEKQDEISTDLIEKSGRKKSLARTYYTRVKIDK